MGDAGLIPCRDIAYKHWSELGHTQPILLMMFLSPSLP